MNLTRRELLKMSAGALLAAELWPGRLAAAPRDTDQASWSFIAVNDLHYREAACRPWFDHVVAAMKVSAPGAAFGLLAGDLSDGAEKEQLTGIQEAFIPLKTRIYATPGNHDYHGDGDCSAYLKVFPEQTNQLFEIHGWQVLGLDTCDGTHFDQSHIQQATLKWVDEIVPRLDRHKPTILFTHFPLAAGVAHRPVNADQLLEKLLEVNLRLVLGGHWHGWSENTVRTTTLVTNRCCSRVVGNHDGSPLKGWTVCEVAGDQITRRFVTVP